ncbi:unnamed protein product, partial [Prorocentrum cordatum]
DREAMLRLLQAATWAARGVCLERLGGAEAAQGALDEVEGLEALSLSELSELGLRLGLPGRGGEGAREAAAGREALVGALGQAAVWRRMPLASLRLECEEKGVLPPESERPVSEQREREELLARLVELLCLGQRLAGHFERLRLRPTATLAAVERARDRLVGRLSAAAAAGTPAEEGGGGAAEELREVCLAGAPGGLGVPRGGGGPAGDRAGAAQGGAYPPRAAGRVGRNFGAAGAAGRQAAAADGGRGHG